MAEPPIAAPIEPPAPPPTTLPLHTLPPPFSHELLSPITQGAEALVYKTHFLTPQTPVVVKYRPPKPYRHPTLDKRLTKQRLLAEARSLLRVKKEGVNVPGVLGADWDAGWLVLEFIEGRTVRRVLDAWAHGHGGQLQREQQEQRQQGKEGAEEGQRQGQGEEEILDLMRRVGREVGKLHAVGVCHGDLTTSNIMLRTPSSPSPSFSSSSSSSKESCLADQQQQQKQQEGIDAEEPSSPPSLQGTIYLIDFGLTSASIADEDKAVDLYVLERAFSATHPAAEPLFQEVLKAYAQTGNDGGKSAKGVLKRLEGVRLRGRKRSMLG